MELKSKTPNSHALDAIGRAMDGLKERLGVHGVANAYSGHRLPTTAHTVSVRTDHGYRRHVLDMNVHRLELRNVIGPRRAGAGVLFEFNILPEIRLPMHKNPINRAQLSEGELMERYDTTDLYQLFSSLTLGLPPSANSKPKEALLQLEVEDPQGLPAGAGLYS